MARTYCAVAVLRAGEIPSPDVRRGGLDRDPNSAIAQRTVIWVLDPIAGRVAEDHPSCSIGILPGAAGCGSIDARLMGVVLTCLHGGRRDTTRVKRASS